MKHNHLLGILSLASSTLHAAPGVETVFQPVALSGQVVPGLTNNVKFSSFNYLSLADDGRIAFTATVSGPGVTSTNNLGLWAGLPDGLDLLLRTGDLVPWLTNGERFTYLAAPNIDNYQYVGALGDFALPAAGKVSAQKLANLVFMVIKVTAFKGTFHISVAAAESFYDLFGHVINVVAGRVELSGSGIDPTNNQAIVAGPPTNVTVVARTGFPAPGFGGNFTGLSLSSEAMALTPGGDVAFAATASDPPATRIGLWFGKAGTLQLVAGKGAAPDSLLGQGYTLGGPSSENVEVNAKGELAFATYLAGPSLNNTNSEFVVAGKPATLRVIAQNGQPAPGIPGAFFQPFTGGSSAFSHVLLGADGAAAFVGCDSASGWDFGLWIAPTDGTTPVLLMHSGQQAPGAPPGVVFTNSFPYLPPFESVFMNSRNQIVFRAHIGGPGVGPNDYGIWLAEPNGTVSFLARTGDSLDVGGGVLKQLSNVTFGTDPEFIAGPEDGRRTPFNDRGEVALLAYFTDSTSGLFLAQTGINLSAERAGNDLHLKFPTLAGKHYRVDYKTNLTGSAWSVLTASVDGTGAQVAVTNSGATISSATRFYRVARTD